jgi:exodeoxyribonuclease V alpha subunit
MKIRLSVVVTGCLPSPLGGAIFTGADASGQTYRFVANFRAVFRAPFKGEIWTIHGSSEHHPKYGKQIQVATGYPDNPSGDLIISFISGNVAGLGRKKAERLWVSFGEDLYTILAGRDLSKLTGVLTEPTARKLLEWWQNVRDKTEVYKFLSHYGFDVRLANKVCKVWPKDTLQQLLANPYRMMAFSSWVKVDAAAKSLGVGSDDPRRLVGAVEAFLYQRLEEKHTVTPEDVLLDGVHTLLKGGIPSQAELAIRHAVENTAASVSAAGYQPVGAAVMERYVATRIHAMISGDDCVQANLFSAQLDSIIQGAIERLQRERRIQLSHSQASAVRMALSNRVSVLTGGAGVGKTTVLSVIHNACELMGVKVIQMALSGRAVQRMRETTGREAVTIAKYLRLQPAMAPSTQPQVLVIIDEASMLDLPLAFSILRALPATASLLLVGDPYQLPPIGFGLVFHVLTSSQSVPRIELTRVHRQAETNSIPTVAQDIRHGVSPSIPSFTGIAPGVSFIEATRDEVMNHIEYVRDEFQGCDDVQVLGITKRGTSGVASINAIFHSRHAARPLSAGRPSFAPGEPVIHLINDYERHLWNGSLGRVESVTEAEPGEKLESKPVMTCNFEGICQDISVEDLRHLDLAYAITVHKAQGSQFKKVIIPIVKSRLLDRTLIYTALTRAVEQAVFIGERRLFDAAVVAPPRSQERMVSLTV